MDGNCEKLSSAADRGVLRRGASTKHPCSTWFIPLMFKMLFLYPSALTSLHFFKVEDDGLE